MEKSVRAWDTLWSKGVANTLPIENGTPWYGGMNQCGGECVVMGIGSPQPLKARESLVICLVGHQAHLPLPQPPCLPRGLMLEITLGAWNLLVESIT